MQKNTKYNSSIDVLYLVFLFMKLNKLFHMKQNSITGYLGIKLLNHVFLSKAFFALLAINLLNME